jgi:hypothetical protein
MQTSKTLNPRLSTEAGQLQQVGLGGCDPGAPALPIRTQEAHSSPRRFRQMVGQSIRRVEQSGPEFRPHYGQPFQLCANVQLDPSQPLRMQTIMPSDVQLG